MDDISRGSRQTAGGRSLSIAAQIGAGEGALNGWLAGKVKPTFQSFLKIRDFLERQVETHGGRRGKGR